MPMSSSGLAAEIISAVGAQPESQDAIQKMAAAIVSHIQKNATVTVTLVADTGVVATGVTSGGASAPVVGTATGTIT